MSQNINIMVHVKNIYCMHVKKQVNISVYLKKYKVNATAHIYATR